MIDLNNLSVFQITALVVSIVFTILALGEIFYTLKNKGNITKSPVLRFCLVIIIPFVAISSWALTILSSIEAFANNEAISIIVALVIGAGLCLASYFIAKAIEFSKKDNNEDDEVEVITVVNKEEKNEEELLSELTAVEKSLQELKDVIDDVIEDSPKQEVAEASQEETITQDEPVIEEIQETVEEIEQPAEKIEEIEESSEEKAETQEQENTENVVEEKQEPEIVPEEVENTESKTEIEPEVKDNIQIEKALEEMIDSIIDDNKSQGDNE